MKKTIFVIITIVVIVIIITLLGKTKSASEPTPAPIAETPVAETAPVPTPVVSVTTKSFTVDGGNYYFKPSTLTVNKGDTVTITFKNVGGMHDFKIDAFNAATKRISTGSEETITFVANKTGTFEYYCSVGDHRKEGMKGTLTVK